VTPQSLPIPQTQVPSARSSSLCSERTQKASEATRTRLRWPDHDWEAVVFNNRVPLCQATLSIGLYLLLEGPVPTRVFYPGRCGIKPLNPHANLSLLRATRLASNGREGLR
jgi:hypothetical protein